MNAQGELISWSFDLEKIKKIVPSHGLLCLTTKGLYSKHSAIYNRAEIVGSRKNLRLRRLANTDGATSTLLSDKTTELAKSLIGIRDANESESRVSLVYGSGGAKRHRIFAAAAVEVGLLGDIINAGIQRPVYGVEFVSNAAEVIWLGHEPRWLVARNADESEYCERATKIWRDRWLKRAQEKLREFIVCPSLPRILLQGEGRDD